MNDVATSNDVRVDQDATQEYAIHQFKNFASIARVAKLIWEGKTNCPTHLSPVYLQIYNHNTNQWDTIASNNTADTDTDFRLRATVSNLTNYKDSRNVISCRVYQEAL